MKAIFATNRLYLWQVAVICLFVLSYFWWPIFWLACTVILVGLLALYFDFVQLKKLSGGITGKRDVHEKLSLGDEQEINYLFENENDKEVSIEIFDELPFQFQQRTRLAIIDLAPHASKNLIHKIRPLERGVYHFGKLNVFISLARPGFLQKKVLCEKSESVKVYPSIIQMKQYALYVFSQYARNYGIRQVRTVGDNDEFEHIRNYAVGDNIRSINWKATARSRQLMVNQFQDSRSQEVYCVIDKGRSMYMPFNGLSLLDYAINTSLVISNIVLQKYDKSGLITFSDKVDDIVKAASHPRQIERISEHLYAQKSDFNVSSYKQLHNVLMNKISSRSILFLISNFDSMVDLQRQIPFLKQVARKHLLIVISFINSELVQEKPEQATSKQEVYMESILDQMLTEKEEIMKYLSGFGIQYILTKPEDLSVNVINKYLEIKSKRMK